MKHESNNKDEENSPSVNHVNRIYFRDKEIPHKDLWKKYLRNALCKKVVPKHS